MTTQWIQCISLGVLDIQPPEGKSPEPLQLTTLCTGPSTSRSHRERVSRDTVESGFIPPASGSFTTCPRITNSESWYTLSLLDVCRLTLMMQVVLETFRRCYEKLLGCLKKCWKQIRQLKRDRVRVSSECSENIMVDLSFCVDRGLIPVMMLIKWTNKRREQHRRFLIQRMPKKKKADKVIELWTSLERLKRYFQWRRFWKIIISPHVNLAFSELLLSIRPKFGQ